MEMTHGGYNPTNARYRMCMNELRNAWIFY
jgi:hypothetical protein